MVIPDRRSPAGISGAVILIGALGAASAARHTAAQTLPPPTFAREIAPIVYEHCSPCHRPDGPAPFSLLTYQDVRQRASQIATVTRTRNMPPWRPQPGFGSFVGERRLTDSQIARFDEWARAGAPEGDPTLLPTRPALPRGWQLGEPDLVLLLPEYTLRADGRDVFRNFVVPYSGARMRYVRGLEFRSGSSAVHHANIRIDITQASRRLDEADPGPGYEGLILRSAEFPDGYFLGWTPGQFAPLAPRGLAWRLADRVDFVVQLHMRPSGRPERVQPALGLFFTDEAPTESLAMLRLGRQNISIGPGESDYRSADEYSLPVEVQVHAIQPHSHYRATMVKAWAMLPDRSTRWLISIPEWDFAWQDVYRVAEPFWLPSGTRIHTEFVFDNSATNPRNPQLPPQPVRWGFKSSDEMGDVWIQVATHTEADRLRLVQDFRPKAASEDVVGYETQIAVEPDNAPLHDDIALLYLELGQPDAAASHFASTVRLRPASPAARSNLGLAHEAAGRMADAAGHYAAAVGLDPAYVPARVNLGNMLLLQGKIAEALAHYREAVRLQPDNAEARNNMGRALSDQGQHREGIEHITEALRLRPTYVVAHFNLAGALLRSGDAAGAVRHYREATRLRPDWTPNLVALAWVLSSHPDPSIRVPAEAVQVASRAADLSGRNDPSALDALAAAYAAQGRFDEAVATAVKAADLAGRAGAAAELAEIQRRLALYKDRRPYVEGIP